MNRLNEWGNLKMEHGVEESAVDSSETVSYLFIIILDHDSSGRTQELHVPVQTKAIYHTIRHYMNHQIGSAVYTISVDD